MKMREEEYDIPQNVLDAFEAGDYDRYFLFAPIWRLPEEEATLVIKAKKKGALGLVRCYKPMRWGLVNVIKTFTGHIPDDYARQPIGDPADFWLRKNDRG